MKKFKTKFDFTYLNSLAVRMNGDRWFEGWFESEQDAKTEHCKQFDKVEPTAENVVMKTWCVDEGTSN